MYRLESPYGPIAQTPELIKGEHFVEDYALAQEIAQDLKLRPRLEDTAEYIRERVRLMLPEDVTEADVLAVSCLTAEAKLRQLRRPLHQNQVRIDQNRRKLIDFHPIRTAKENRQLYREQELLHKQGTECEKAINSYYQETIEAIKT